MPIAYAKGIVRSPNRWFSLRQNASDNTADLSSYAYTKAGPRQTPGEALLFGIKSQCYLLRWIMGR